MTDLIDLQSKVEAAAANPNLTLGVAEITLAICQIADRQGGQGSPLAYNLADIAGVEIPTEIRHGRMLARSDAIVVATVISHVVESSYLRQQSQGLL